MRLGLTGLAVAASLTALPAPAAAFDNSGPVPLGPSRPLHDPRSSSEPDPRSLGRPANPGIEIGRIESPRAAWDDTPAGPNQTLGPDSWAGTPPQLAEALIRQLPLGVPSPTLGSLTRALLLSPGPASAPPPGQREQIRQQRMMLQSRDGTAQLAMNITRTQRGPSIRRRVLEDPAFAAARINQLFEAGFLDDAAKLLDSQAARGANEDLRRVRASAHLLRGEDDKACDLAGRMRLESDDSFWVQLRAYCYLTNGDASAADLTIRLLTEQTDTPPLFAGLMLHLSQGLPVDDKAWKTRIDPLCHAMLRRSDLEVPAEALARAAPSVQHTIARGATDASGEDALVHVIRSAQESVANGTLTPQDLANAYSAPYFDASMLKNPMRFAGEIAPELANALYYQRLQQTPQPALRLELIYEALGAADRSNSYLPVALLYGPAVREIAPTPKHKWAADRLGLAALIAGDTEAAVRWQEILAAEASRTKFLPQQESLRVLTMGLALLDTRMALGIAPELDIADWIKRTRKAKLSPVRLARDLQILQAAGIPLSVDAEIWLLNHAQAVRVAAPPINPGRLASAVQHRRRGEAVAVALILAGEKGPQADAPNMLAMAISALSQVGLKTEARRVAFEALLADPA